METMIGGLAGAVIAPSLGAAWASRFDPACANLAAVRAYEKAGFRAVGVMRRSEREVGGDGWRVVLGDDARMEEKLAVTLALLKGERPWRTLDVTDPDRPFYK